MNNEEIKIYLIEGTDYIKVKDLKWVIKHFKKSIAGQDKMGKVMLEGIEVMFRLKRVGNNE